MWQDTVLALTQVIFAIALIPTILHPTKKPTLATSFTNASVISLVVLVYATLGLLASTLGAITLGLEWGLLAYQRYALDRVGKGESALSGNN